MHTKNQIVLFIIITTAIIFLLAVVIVMLLYFYQKRQLAYNKNFESLKLDFEKNLLKTEIEIQEQTFQYISREIHDNINLSLTLVKLNLVTADLNDREKITNNVNSSVDLLSTTIADLSNLSRSINTDLIREIGLMKAIRRELDRLETMAGFKVSYGIKGEPVFMKAEKDLVIFRIIQEAFNNIVKHSKATEIILELDYSDHYLDIMIKDNGVGFDEEAREQDEECTAGIKNMKHRARLFGGDLIMKSRPDRGTQILITIPYYS